MLHITIFNGKLNPGPNISNMLRIGPMAWPGIGFSSKRLQAADKMPIGVPVFLLNKKNKKNKKNEKKMTRRKKENF